VFSATEVGGGATAWSGFEESIAVGNRQSEIRNGLDYHFSPHLFFIAPSSECHAHAHACINASYILTYFYFGSSKT